MPADYMTIADAAKLWRRSANTIRRWCQRAQIPGATKFGKQWAVPRTATPPQLPTGAAAHQPKETQPCSITP
jgi:transposase